MLAADNSQLRTAFVRCYCAILLSSGFTSAWAGDFAKLPEAATDEAKRLAVVFDFDRGSCYPSAAISDKGEVNGGLNPSGDETGECRDAEQLDNSNTYYRKRAITKNGKEYAVHMYALYFQKDQWMPVSPGSVGGHRHDWEFALVWTTDGKVTHASCSAHGDVETKPTKADHVKVFYHKDGVKTHSFCFPEENKEAENDKHAWITPTLVDWTSMKSDAVSNAQLRETLNKHDFGEANCPFNDANFANAIAKSPPEGYPSADEWKNSK